ncbi:MAG: alpha-ribazole phosphatase [Limnochordia bacterium]|jgi:alpha-ribazole phosphatase
MEESKLKLILLRHGETDYNLQGRYQGQSDVPLSERGRKQGELVGRRLAGQSFDFIVSSDLSRAQETAQIVNGYLGLPMFVDSRWREIAFGQWEGHTAQEIAQGWPQELQTWREDPSRACPPGGEALLDVQARLMEALEDLAAQRPGQNGIIVLHGGAIRIICATILGLDLTKRYRIPTDNGSLTTIAKKGPQWALLTINDVAHLAGEPCGGGLEV